VKSFEILVVDHDVTILEFLVSALSKMGYRVTAIDDPQAAIDLLGEKRFHLIFTDLIMEPVDGFQVLAAAKKMYQEVPVIVLTGNVDSNLAIKALRLQADDYLFKPVELQSLYYRVSSCLEKAELKKKIERNRKDLDLFKAVTDFSNEAVAIWDLNGRVIYANPAYQVLFGCSQEEALTLHYGSFLTAKSAEILESEVLPALDEGKGWEGVLDSVDAKKRNFPLWQRFDAIRDDEDRMSHIFGFMHDFTKERKDAENFTRKQKMEALGTLAGGIAHEFNNIIWIIGANTELMSAYIGEESLGIKNLQRVEKACTRAADLVTQILNFSHQNEYDPKPLEIIPLVKESLKLLRVSIPTIIEIREQIPRESGTITFEPSLMHQVLMNLYENAVQAMRETGGVLEVKVENVSLDKGISSLHDDLSHGEYVKLSVSDTGVGIPSEVLERIFDPFFTTRDIGEGTGMGLAVVQGAVKNHGGAVEARSEPGKGTCIDLFFPRARRIERKPSELSDIPMGRGENILLVDDDELVVQSGESVLKRLGYRVKAEVSCTEALEAFRRHPDEFDLVITDMSMPQMTGLMLAEALLEIRPNIPIILFSGHHDMVDEKMAIEIGIKALMMKPIKPRDMARTIGKVLGYSTKAPEA
jgi:PAS domain S-box-containing protein